MRPSSEQASFRWTNGRPVQKPDRDFDAGLAQPLEPAPGDERVRVFDGRDDAPDARAYQRLGAGRRAARVRVRFERDVGGRAARSPAGLFERQRLGVLHALVGVEALADDAAPGVRDDAPDERAGAHEPAPPRSEVERAGHHARVESVSSLGFGVESQNCSR